MKKIIAFMLVTASMLMAKIEPPLDRGECTYTQRFSLDLIWRYAGSNDVAFACRGVDDRYYEVAFDRNLTEITFGTKYAGSSSGYKVVKTDKYRTYIDYYDDLGIKVKSEDYSSSQDEVIAAYHRIRRFFGMPNKL